MDFAELHQYNPHYEKNRKGAKKTTFKGLLEGTSIHDLRPNPLPCPCGEFPKIESEEDHYNVRCSKEECDNDYYNVGSNYQQAIFFWNQNIADDFDFENNKIHPLVWYNHGFDDPDVMFRQIDRIEVKLKKIEGYEPISNKERRLIALIREWNQFARVIGQRIKKSQSQEEQQNQASSEPNPASEARASIPAEESPKAVKPSKKVEPPVPKKSIAEMLEPFAAPKIKGPLFDYIDHIQHIGDAYYLMVHGHHLRIKQCAKTGMHIPVYIVYIRHGQGTPGYQVRIDLRSLGVPYYSKMHYHKNIEVSLANALSDLCDKLKDIKVVKKRKSMIDRGKSRNFKAIDISDNRAITLLHGKNDSNHRLEVTLSAPSQHAGARFAQHLGGHSTLSYRRYEQAAYSFSRLSLLHTAFGSDPKTSYGGNLPFSELDILTQKAVSRVCAELMDLPVSDVIIQLVKLDPKVRVGYLPCSSLREDCKATQEDAPMQVVSVHNKAGYLSGYVKKHDLLNNAECVVIDSILDSNLVEFHQASLKPVFKPGTHRMAVCLSKLAVEALVKEKPNMEIKCQSIKLLTPMELLQFCHGEDIPPPEQLAIIIERNDENLIAFQDDIRTNCMVSLSDWNYDERAALLQLCHNVRAFHQSNQFQVGSSSRHDLAARYRSLELIDSDIDLANVRFLSAQRSETGIRNLKIRESGKMYYHNRQDGEKLAFDKPESLAEFRNCIEALFSLENELNNDEIQLLEHVYQRSFEQA